MENGAKVLVVDDEKTLRDIVSMVLTKAGHQCVTACDGEEALSLAKKQAFDLVLTDLKMPKMDGLALIDWLRREHPDLPIIIMTGYGDLESARKALRLRVSDYLVKPFESLAELQATVQGALEARTARSGTPTLVKEFETRAREFERREKHLTQTLACAEVEIEALADRLEGSEVLAADHAGQLDTMIDNLENGILVTDANDLVLSSNPELRRQLQAGNLRGVGFPVDRLPGDSVLREAMIESRQQLHSGIEEPVYAATEAHTGEQHAYEIRSTRFGGDGDVGTGVVTIVRPLRPKTTKAKGSAGVHSGRAVVAPWG